MICYRPAELSDVAWLAPRLRAADAAEALAASGLAPEAALRASLRCSARAITAEVQGQPAAIFGVAPAAIMSGEGRVWMLGTDAVQRHARALLVDAPLWLDELAQGFRRLGNVVDARHGHSIRWLRRLGFQFGHAAPAGPFGLPFLPFWKEVAPCVRA